jgi:hypothetical protein
MKTKLKQKVKAENFRSANKRSKIKRKRMTQPFFYNLNSMAKYTDVSKDQWIKFIESGELEAILTPPREEVRWKKIKGRLVEKAILLPPYAEVSAEDFKTFCKDRGIIIY